jgi:hypothetical protein
MGAEGARTAAREWRREQLEQAGLPNPAIRRLVLKPRSGSGIVGVSYRPASPRRSGTAAWVACYQTVTGEKKSRSFSVGKYGKDEARERAIAERAEWEREELGTSVAGHEPAPMDSSLTGRLVGADELHLQRYIDASPSSTSRAA